MMQSFPRASNHVLTHSHYIPVCDGRGRLLLLIAFPEVAQSVSPTFYIPPISRKPCFVPPTQAPKVQAASTFREVPIWLMHEKPSVPEIAMNQTTGEWCEFCCGWTDDEDGHRRRDCPFYTQTEDRWCMVELGGSTAGHAATVQWSSQHSTLTDDSTD